MKEAERKFTLKKQEIRASETRTKNKGSQVQSGQKQRKRQTSCTAFEGEAKCGDSCLGSRGLSGFLSRGKVSKRTTQEEEITEGLGSPKPSVISLCCVGVAGEEGQGAGEGNGLR